MVSFDDTFIDNNAKLLSRLAETGSLSASSVQSKAAKTLFLQLEQANLIQKKRKGAGNHYQLINDEGLCQYIISTYPSGLNWQELPNTPRRVKGILTNKNSKTLKKLEFDLLTLRGSLTLHHDNKTHNLAHLTSDKTYLSLKLTPESYLDIKPTKRTIVTVENPTAFTELNLMIQSRWDMAVYTQGKISNILLSQLAYWGKQGHHLIHFGDYDYVGLLEFTRILTVCPNAQIYAPEIFTIDFLKRYGNSQLLEDQTTQHQSLKRTISNLPNSKGKCELTRIYHLLLDAAKGLEQESFYLQDSAS